MNRHGIRAPGTRATPAAITGPGPGRWTAPGLATELQMPTATVYNWIYRGWITAKHAPGHNFWIIHADAAELQRLRERRSRPPGYHTRARWAQLATPQSPEGTPP